MSIMFPSDECQPEQHRINVIFHKSRIKCLNISTLLSLMISFGENDTLSYLFRVLLAGASRYRP